MAENQHLADRIAGKVNERGEPINEESVKIEDVPLANGISLLDEFFVESETPETILVTEFDSPLTDETPSETEIGVVEENVDAVSITEVPVYETEITAQDTTTPIVEIFAKSSIDLHALMQEQGDGRKEKENITEKKRPFWKFW